MNILSSKYFQIALLGILVLFFLVTTPSDWIQFPDSGYYLGTAENILRGLGYWFNGYPNLQYYPGTSIVIAFLIGIFGVNFAILQGFMAVLALGGVYLVSRYYSRQNYGWAGFFTPFLLLFSGIFSIHIFALLSDALFLTLSMATLVLWRSYKKSLSINMLWVCAIVIGFATLVRLQGLFLCAAFGLALMLDAYYSRNDIKSPSLVKVFAIGLVTILPFVVWTLRNYLFHSPDTFNMANDFFFDLKGLRIYAKGLQGDVSFEHISSVWEFAYLRTTLFVGGLFESWYGGVNQFNRTIVTLVMLTSMAFGLRPWIKKASNLELIYVFISLLYLAKGILMVKNLHIVYRYWVPMLPFVIIIMGLGLTQITQLAIFNKCRKLAQAGAVSLVLILLVSSFPNLTEHLRQAEKYQNENAAIEALADFSQQNLPEDAIVATVDWGILPRALERQSYQVLNDPSFIHTVTRMAKYRTNYLVTYGKFGRMTKPALAMVDKYPGSFTRIFSTFDQHPNTQIQVFEVDLDSLAQQVLGN